MIINNMKEKHFFVTEKVIGKNTSATAQLSWWKPEFFKEIFYFQISLLDYDCIFRFDFTLFSNLFNFTIYWTRRTDHAGLHLNITLFGLFLMLGTYDHRHWDDDLGTYETYN